MKKAYGETLKLRICNVIIIMIMILILLTGCQGTDQEVSRFSHDPVRIMVFGKEASYQRSIVVFHKNGVVSKMKIIDKTVFDKEDVELINEFDAINKITYDGDVFDIAGFTQYSKIKGNVYTSTVVLEYGEMDMNLLIDQGNWFIHAKEIVNDDLKVDYIKLEKIILESGCTPVN